MTKEENLENLNIKDSKLLTKKQRNFLYKKLIYYKHKIIIIKPKEIDNALNSDHLNLNWLEAIYSAKIINELNPNKTILDCPSPNIQAYKNYLKKLLKNKDTELIIEHKADHKYKIVGAASILAKVTRDREIEKIKKQYKIDFGSGYSSDPRTQKFLEDNHNSYPEIIRSTWMSFKNAKNKKEQRKLNDF